MDLVACARHVEPVERLLRRFGLAFGRAEGSEVVLADEPLGGGVHRVGVEPARHPPGAAAVDREIGPPVGDAIEIMPPHRRAARVEIRRDFFRRQDRYRMRAQMRVERVADGVGLALAGKIEMRDLAERVHARVGAAGALHHHLLAGEQLDRRHDRALHRGRIVLDTASRRTARRRIR